MQEQGGTVMLFCHTILCDPSYNFQIRILICEYTEVTYEMLLFLCVSCGTRRYLQ